jgi:hypothetical protein
MNSEAFSSREGRGVVENIGHPVQGEQTGGEGCVFPKEKKACPTLKKGWTGFQKHQDLRRIKI